jgi:hypothetical protein
MTAGAATAGTHRRQRLLLIGRRYVPNPYFESRPLKVALVTVP